MESAMLFSEMFHRLLGSHRRPTPYGSTPAAAYSEVLASRQMLSGNVTAALVDGALTISGDSKDNAIQISVYQTSPTAIDTDLYETEAFIAITGINDTTIDDGSGPRTTVEFSLGMHEIAKSALAFPTPNYAIASLDIDLGRGNDSANINLTYFEPPPISVPYDASVTARTTPPRYPITQVQIDGNSHVALGAGDDSLILSGGNFERRLTVNGQAGDDEIRINSAMRNVTVLGSRGDDQIDISGTVDRTATIRSAGGADAVSLSGTIHRANVSTGSGDDSVSVNGQLNYFRATTSRGNDDITLLAAVAQQTRIDTGDGDDTLNLAGSLRDGIGTITHGLALPQYNTPSSASLSGHVRIHLGDGDDALVAARYVGIRTPTPIPFSSDTEFKTAQAGISEPALSRIGVFLATASIKADGGVINGGRGRDSLTVAEAVLDDLSSLKTRRFESTSLVDASKTR